MAAEVRLETHPHDEREPRYIGLRMDADCYLALEPDGCIYELIDGVVVMSPSPTPRHQAVLRELMRQLALFLEQHPVGEIFPEIDIRISRSKVLRPELVFVRSERIPADLDRPFEFAPDVVVEIISHSSRAKDTKTKFDDYAEFGIPEYWLIDPLRDACTFFRLADGKYVATPHDEATYISAAVPGFTLDLRRLRESFPPRK